MNVLLIKPYNLSDHIQPPLGLGYLATAIKPKHNIKLVDCVKTRIKNSQQLINIVKEFKADIVGVQCYTVNLKFIKSFFTEVKIMDSGIKCIVGGPHPSAVPVETMELFSSCLDYGFQGEAEIGFPKLLDMLSAGAIDMSSVPGLIWRKDGRITVNAGRFVEDLDSLQYPAWDLMRPNTYPEAQHGAFYKRFPIAPIITTRGCPYPCTFCAAHKIAGKNVRKHSIQYVLEEIKMLYDDFGVREFHIVDDNFTYDINYAKSLLKGLIKLGLDISWATPNGIRLDKLDEELLVLMKQSGLYLISAGIESGSDRVLKLIRKGATVSRIEENIRMIRRADIEIAGFFIIGYPGETKEDIECTIRFARKLDLVRANFFTYLPFPGTESFNRLKENNELEKVDWDNFYFMDAPYVPKGMTRKELKWYHRKAFLTFFLRPKIFIKNIVEIKSFKHFWFLFNRFYNWILKGQ